eukprot:CAMPEP_0184865070 /NCGR_PEP_ID=MMETSP0580-20130426/16845_1 /TAXON_ID=1118495 /ORGANISM="Dactyliosolen fragilissimus" /LENGTH=607 /DNA_ID=CAMNT_0027364091 /DNA_START=27 /DNA_END=1850 /DNA_ORIENTATION=-
MLRRSKKNSSKKANKNNNDNSSSSSSKEVAVTNNASAVPPGNGDFHGHTNASSGNNSKNSAPAGILGTALGANINNGHSKSSSSQPPSSAGSPLNASKGGGNIDVRPALKPQKSLSIPANTSSNNHKTNPATTTATAHQPRHSNAANPTNISPTHNPFTISPNNNVPINGQLPLIGAPMSAIQDLPALRDSPPNKREELFLKKLKLCSVIFAFDDPTADKHGKDTKRQTLLELVDYVNTQAGQKIFTEAVMSDLMACVTANVCRALPPATDDFDPEEDEPVFEPAWPHLQVAYEFFLRFIVSSEVNARTAKKYVDQKFCLQLVELFDSEDPRERDYLKTILHRIYGKFMSHRSFIRRAISNVFYRFVYETERHNGIGELLEILGSIINGFAIPLKKEHLQFLVRALIPLHKPKCVTLYHQQLSYCIIQYVEKDADTATPILKGFFKCWPWSCSSKQVLFLNELEEILELIGAEQLSMISKTLFTNLARCLDSDHFQVVERALFLWNNEHLVNSGCLSRLNAQTVLPIIYGPLYKNSSGHWNATVEGLAQNVLKMYMEYDLVLYDKCTTAYFKEEEEAKRKIEAVSGRWAQIEEMAQTNARARLVTSP